jgi:hypothetical protein
MSARRTDRSASLSNVAPRPGRPFCRRRTRGTWRRSAQRSRRWATRRTLTFTRTWCASACTWPTACCAPATLATRARSVYQIFCLLLVDFKKKKEDAYIYGASRIFSSCIWLVSRAAGRLIGFGDTASGRLLVA